MFAVFRWALLVYSCLAIILAESTTTISPDLQEYLCGPGLELVRNGQCRGTAELGRQDIPYNQGLAKGIELCSALDAFPIIIKNDEEEAYWIHQVDNTSPLGITCNATSGKWQWVDGSPVDYRPRDYDKLLDQQCSPGITWSLYAGTSYWYRQPTSITYLNFDFYCVHDVYKPSQTDSDCVEFDESNSLCYQISEAGDIFREAQKICKSAGYNLASIQSVQENSYVRRLAVSRGLVNGILLGATATGNSNTFEWIDGSAWNYTNFLPGFPIDGVGSCLVMDTNDVNGKWANVDCSARLPFVCEGKPHTSNEICQAANVREGDVITTPGFPSNASIFCDFFLFADSGKVVEMEILLLEANSCCDHFLLYDGEFGGSLIANLTGAMTGGKYRTTKSNVMRASWQPNGGVNVRGVMMTYRGV